MLKIKVCGLRYQDNITDVAKLQPDYMGFIFYKKSLRHVTDIMTPNIQKEIVKTGVFVDESLQKMVETARFFRLRAIQLHGDQSPEICKALKERGLMVIKVFRVDNHFDFKILENYESVSDYFLFDTFTPSFGGSGKAFNLEILKEYPSKKKIFISGGIGLDNIEQILNQIRLYNIPTHAIDINSRFEISPALKDIFKLKHFFDIISNAQS